MAIGEADTAAGEADEGATAVADQEMRSNKVAVVGVLLSFPYCGVDRGEVFTGEVHLPPREA